MPLVSLHDIELAAERVAATCLRTPVLALRHDRPGSSLWVKAENLQPTGAFKLRGASNAIAQLADEQQAAGVITHSSGNHGQALAYAARAAGIRATVVMPDGAPGVKVDATRRWGAEVVLVPVAERASACAAIADETGAVFIPPFDDPWIIAGQGTIGLELVEQVPDLEVVLVPVSGGGLISGIATAIKALRPEVAVIGVEPELAGDLAEGFALGEHRTWSSEQTARTMADGLRVPAVGDHNWEHIRAHVDDVVTVTEEAIADTMRRLAQSCRLVVEPSGAVAAAAWFECADRLPSGVAVAVVSGGNVDLDLYARIVGSLQ